MRDEITALHKKRLLDEHPPDQNSGISSSDPNIQADSGGQSGSTVEVDSEKVIAVVNKAVASIMTRLNSLSYFDKSETNKMTTLVQAASNIDNLCRMDPTWHPWL